MSKPQKNVGRVLTRQATSAHGDVGLRDETANPTYGAGAWIPATLADVSSDVSYGYTESASSDKVGPRFLRITDIQNGVVDWGNVPYCPISEANHRKYRLDQGDIVVARTGNSTGENFLFRGNEAAVYASYLIRFRVDLQKAVPAFVWYNLRSDSWWSFINNSKTGSAQAGANAKILGQFPINLPPIVEQKAIAHILGTLDDKIELNRRMNATLEAMARALFQSWFVDFDPIRAKLDGRKPTGLDAATAALFPAHFQDSSLGHIPQGWEVKTVGEIGNVVCGKTPSTAVSDYYGNDIPFITIPDMHGNVFAASTGRKLSRSGADSQANKTLPHGSICVSCIATPGLVVITSENSQTNQQINSVVPHQHDESYFWYWVMTGLGAEIASSGSGGSVLANLSKGRFETLQVVKPPHALIRAYHSSVTSRMICRIYYDKLPPSFPRRRGFFNETLQSDTAGG